jgi:hypothetical protein
MSPRKKATALSAQRRDLQLKRYGIKPLSNPTNKLHNPQPPTKPNITLI